MASKKIKGVLEVDYKPSAFKGMWEYLKGGVATLDGGTMWTPFTSSTTVSGVFTTSATGSGWSGWDPATSTVSTYKASGTWSLVWGTGLTDEQQKMVEDAICEQIANPSPRARYAFDLAGSATTTFTYSYDET